MVTKSLYVLSQNGTLGQGCRGGSGGGWVWSARFTIYSFSTFSHFRNEWQKIVTLIFTITQADRAPAED